MPFITFIYKVGNNNKTYCGKYFANYVSDDHEGLDNVVKYDLIGALNKYRKNKKIKKIIIGVLSFSSNDVIPIYSSDSEIKCFDFYRNYDGKIFINGKLI